MTKAAGVDRIVFYFESYTFYTYMQKKKVVIFFSNDVSQRTIPDLPGMPMIKCDHKIALCLCKNLCNESQN